MKKYILFFLLLGVWALSFLEAITITVASGTAPRIITSIDQSFYGSEVQLNINNDTAGNIYLKARINQPPTLQNSNVTIPQNNFGWKASYISSGAFLKGTGANDHIPYTLSDDYIAVIPTGNSIVKVATFINYIPAVQAAGDYLCRITYTAEP